MSEELRKVAFEGFDFKDVKVNPKDDEISTDGNCYNIKKGDVIQLGIHWLLCGDSTNSNEVANFIDKRKFDMIFFDPPFQDENNIQETD